MKITVYQKPTCTTCRQVYAALREAGVDFEAVDYYTDPIPKTKLRQLLRKMGIPASALLRTKEEIYKTLRLGEKDLTDDQIIDLMVKYPDLIQRPIVEKGSRAILARPAERIKEILVAVLVLFVVSWPLVAQGQTADSTGRAERRLPAPYHIRERRPGECGWTRSEYSSMPSVPWKPLAGAPATRSSRRVTRP